MNHTLKVKIKQIRFQNFQSVGWQGQLKGPRSGNTEQHRAQRKEDATIGLGENFRANSFLYCTAAADIYFGLKLKSNELKGDTMFLFLVHLKFFYIYIYIISEISQRKSKIKGRNT